MLYLVPKIFIAGLMKFGNTGNPRPFTCMQDLLKLLNYWFFGVRQIFARTDG